MQSAFNNATFKKIVAAVERSTGVEAHRISLATRLGDDLALDKSSGRVLAGLLKERHDIELSLAQLERFASIADIVSYSSRQYFKDVEPSRVAVTA